MRRKCGSSPHAWGTPGKLSHDQAVWRFIPTCVGNTSGSGNGTARTAVHPHMRGEHSSGPPLVFLVCGSSPHAWGTRHSDQEMPSARRFIPTCVGNTYSLEDVP